MIFALVSQFHKDKALVGAFSGQGTVKLREGLLTALISTATTRSSSGPRSPRPRLLEWRRRCRRGVRGPRSPRCPRRPARRCTRATRWSSPPRCPPGNPPSPAPRHPSSGNSQVSSKALPLNIEIVWLCDKTNIFAFLNTLGFRQYSLIEIKIISLFCGQPSILSFIFSCKCIQVCRKQSRCQNVQ